MPHPYLLLNSSDMLNKVKTRDQETISKEILLEASLSFLGTSQQVDPRSECSSHGAELRVKTFMPHLPGFSCFQGTGHSEDLTPLER